MESSFHSGTGGSTFSGRDIGVSLCPLSRHPTMPLKIASTVTPVENQTLALGGGLTQDNKFHRSRYFQTWLGCAGLCLIYDKISHHPSEKTTDAGQRQQLTNAVSQVALSVIHARKQHVKRLFQFVRDNRDQWLPLELSTEKSTLGLGSLTE